VQPTWERVYVAGREQWRYVPSRWDHEGEGGHDRYEAYRYH
jgi:hypothetical protein